MVLFCVFWFYDWLPSGELPEELAGKVTVNVIDVEFVLPILSFTKTIKLFVPEAAVTVVFPQSCILAVTPFNSYEQDAADVL